MAGLSSVLLFVLARTVCAQAQAPSIDAIGPARVLYQNDLTGTVNQTALLLSEPVVYDQASQKCQLVSESILPAVEDNVYAQLRYLVFNGEINETSAFWVGGTQRSSARFKRQQICDAYDYSTNSITQEDCSAELPVLCSNTAQAFTAAAELAPAETAVMVQAGNLSVTGFRDARAWRFLGVPFAAPPLNDLRFAPAQPYQGSNNINATSFQSACIQPVSEISAPASEQSEDCLTLNIYSPALPTANASSKPLPVAAWIYGGAFVAGSASNSYYDGGNLAARGDVIVVTANYRLGALGQLATATQLDGSQSVTDNLQALRWIQEYIQYFGGDPNRVTVFGESAGGASVLALLSSSAAQGLFHGAIAQSAPFLAWQARSVYTDAVTPAVGRASNCTNVEDETALVSCLRGLDARAFVDTSVIGAAAAALLNATADIGATESGTATRTFLPTIGTGNGILAGQFNDLLRSGELPIKNVSLMIGNLRDEGTYFLAGNVPQLQPTYEALDAVARAVLPSQAADAVANNTNAFPLNTTNPYGLLLTGSQLLTLYTWQCPLQQALSTAVSQQTFTKLYTYRMDRGILLNPLQTEFCRPDSPSGLNAACHTEDLSEVFGSSDVQFNQYNENNPLAYNQQVIDSWIAMFRNSDPTPNTEYLRARGQGYEATLAAYQAVPFRALTDSSASQLHLFDYPSANNSNFVYQEACSILQNVGFLPQLAAASDLY